MLIEDKIDNLEDFLKKWKENDVLYMDGDKLDAFFKNNLEDYELQQTVLTCIYGVKLVDYYSFEDFKYAFSHYDKDDIRDYLKSLELSNGESLWDLFEYFNNSNLSAGGTLALEMFSRSAERTDIVDFLLSNKNTHSRKLKEELPILSLKSMEDLEIEWINDRFKFYQLLKFKDLEDAIYQMFFIRNDKKLNTNVKNELERLEESFILKSDYSYIAKLLKKEHELIINDFLYSKKGKEIEEALILKDILNKRSKSYHHRMFFNKLLTYTQESEPENEYDVLLSSLKTFKDAKKRGHNIEEQVDVFLRNINYRALEKSLISIVEDESSDEYKYEILINKKSWYVLFLLKNFENNEIVPERFSQYFERMVNTDNYGFWSVNVEDSSSLILERLRINEKNDIKDKKSYQVKYLNQDNKENEKHSIVINLTLKKELKDYISVIKGLLMETLLNLTIINQKKASITNKSRVSDLDEHLSSYIYDLIDSEVMKMDLNLEKENKIMIEKKKVLKF